MRGALFLLRSGRPGSFGGFCSVFSSMFFVVVLVDSVAYSTAIRNLCPLHWPVLPMPLSSCPLSFITVVFALDPPFLLGFRCHCFQAILSFVAAATATKQSFLFCHGCFRFQSTLSFVGAVVATKQSFAPLPLLVASTRSLFYFPRCRCLAAPVFLVRLAKIRNTADTKIDGVKIDKG